MFKQTFAAMAATLFCFGLLFGCKGEEAPKMAAVIDESGEYARVNDVVISNNDFASFAKGKRESQPEANLSDKAIADELIATEILRQEAINAGISKRPEIVEQIKLQESNILINTLMTEKFADLKFTDDELKAEYDRLIGLNDASEFKARHILLQTEDEAKVVIEELNGGANFEELAKAKSQGPSAPNGGDLGWFKAETMVPAFAEAVGKMEKGAYSTEGVNTRFGWHVILLEDKRTTEQPAFDDVKQNVQQSLTRQTIESYVDELEGKATITRSDETAETAEPAADS
ncbi:MAG: peptidylprolyl isomerase [Gammaproteobacteria bacterium]|nr:MAG: peptidylprolyl isomerase [Gammaproteobacteria bacterium]